MRHEGGVDRRRLVIVVAALGLVGITFLGCVWRIRVSIAEHGGIGPTAWTAQRLLDIGARAETAGGLLAAAVVASGAAAGALALGRPARLSWPGVGFLVVGLGLTALAVDLASSTTMHYSAGGVTVNETEANEGIALLWTLLVVAAPLVVGWSWTAWVELGRPIGPPAHEASRVLFAAAPVLLPVYLVLGEELARLHLDAPGLAGGASAGSITATGAVLLSVAIVRIVRRGRGTLGPS